MSSTLAFSFPELLPEPESQPRHVEIVTTRSQRRARPRLAYAIVAVGGLLAIFLGQLGLSIALSNGAYEISALLIDQRSQTRLEGALIEQTEVMASTQNLAQMAQGLGMINTSTPAFLDLETGDVSGLATAADGATSNTSIANALLGGGESDALNFKGEPVAVKPDTEQQDEAPVPAGGPSPLGGGTLSTAGVVGGAAATPTGAPAGQEPAALVASDPGALPSPVTR